MNRTTEQIQRESNLDFMRDELSRMLGECDALQNISINETPDFRPVQEFSERVAEAFVAIKAARELIAQEQYRDSVARGEELMRQARLARLG